MNPLTWRKDATINWIKDATPERRGQLRKTVNERGEWRLSVWQNTLDTWTWTLDQGERTAFVKIGDAATRRHAQIIATQALNDKLAHEAMLDGR